MRVSGKVWKVLGVAGVAGVAATGAVVARDQRRRTQLQPEQVRKQLHQRLADLERDGDLPAASDEPAPGEVAPVPVKRRRRRRR